MERVPAGHLAHEADFFVLRSPSQPRDLFSWWSSGLTASRAVRAGNESDLARALESDRAVLRRRLRDWVANPLVREALFVASRTFSESIESWLADPENPRGREVEYPLLRYLTRMTTRATPFGIFSGVSTGMVGTETRIALVPENDWRRVCRIDAGALGAICADLAAGPGIRPSLAFRKNPTLYRHAGMLHFTSRRRHRNGTEHASEVLAENEYLLTALQYACNESTLDGIADAVCAEHPEVVLDDARDFVGAMADHQLILCDLEPVLTGSDAVGELIRQLSQVMPGADAVRRLAHADCVLSELNVAPLAHACDRYKVFDALLSPMMPKWARSLDRVQVDLYKPAERAVLAKGVIDEIRAGVDALHRLQRRSSSPCEEFADSFAKRYGDKEVPLLEALDEEIGIGFGRRAARVAYGSDLPWDPVPQKASGTVRFGARERWLLARLTEALRAGDRELRITDADLTQFPAQHVPVMPDAFSVNAVIHAQNWAGIDGGDFVVQLLAVAGPSGARLIGRFCHMDPGLLEAVRSHLRAEEALRPDAVFAEIVDVLNARDGNFAHRPVLREYEIPLAGRSGVAPDRQLPPDDLRVSVAAGRVVLRSARLGREVIPRLTTAQNPLRATPLHRFLFALQDQGASGNVSWDWDPFDAAPYLPRVVYGRAVLAAARWLLTPAEQRHLKGQRSDADRMHACADLRAKRGLPRFVRFNNALIVDFENVLSVGAMIAILKERPVLLHESMLDFDASVVTGPEGGYEHEIVVPFVRGADPPATRAATGAAAASVVQRSFLPGSDWLFAKIYAGATAADALICDAVMPLVSKLRAEMWIENWFFIRYADPDWHIRLRFRGAAMQLASKVLPLLREACEECLSDGRVWRLQLDTYEREIGRYGGSEGILLAERLFEADSDCVAELLAALSCCGLDQERFHLAVAGVDRLLDDFGIATDLRLSLVRDWRDGWLSANGSARDFSIGAGAMYRAGRTALESVLRDGADSSGSRWGDAFAARSMRLAEVVRALRRHESSGKLTKSILDLIRSFAHMHVNRMLKAATASEECLVYEFLVRWYGSQVARAGNCDGRSSRS